MGCTVRDRIPVATRFSARPDRPWGPPSLLYNGYLVFSVGKVRPGRAADHSPPSSAAAMEGHTGPVTGSLYLYLLPVNGLVTTLKCLFSGVFIIRHRKETLRILSLFHTVKNYCLQKMFTCYNYITLYPLPPLPVRFVCLPCYHCLQDSIRREVGCHLMA